MSAVELSGKTQLTSEREELRKVRGQSRARAINLRSKVDVEREREGGSGMIGRRKVVFKGKTVVFTQQISHFVWTGRGQVMAWMGEAWLGTSHPPSVG